MNDNRPTEQELEDAIKDSSPNAKKKMKRNTTKIKFLELLNKAMKKDGDILAEADIRALAESGGYDIEPGEAVRVWHAKKAAADASENLLASDDLLDEMYMKLDARIATGHPELVVFRRGENAEFYAYMRGYYKRLAGIEIEDLVDKTMHDLGLLQQRSARRMVRDTVARLASTLGRLPGRHFSDESIIEQRWRINLANGLLDPVTLVLEPHTPKYFSTSQSPFGYDVNAQCPQFLDFVDQIMGSDPESTLLLQEIAGYCLTDGNPRHKIFYLYGATARNGKSTFANILCGILGHDNTSRLSLEALTKDNSPIILPLVGSQLNFSDELSSKYMDSPRLASISAEGTVSINPKYKPTFDYAVKAKLVVACNDLPRFADAQGMMVRTIVIEFGVQIEEKNRIFNLDKTLLACEGAGILQWAIQGMLRLRKQNAFTSPRRSEELQYENRLANNYVLAYIESDFFKYDPDFGKENERSAADLFGRPLDRSQTPAEQATGYLRFCETNNVKGCSMWSFKRELSRLADAPNAKIRKIKSDGRMVYRGLAINLDF